MPEPYIFKVNGVEHLLRHTRMDAWAGWFGLSEPDATEVWVVESDRGDVGLSGRVFLPVGLVSDDEATAIIAALECDKNTSFELIPPLEKNNA